MSVGEIRRHFWSPTKLHTMLLDAAAVARLRRPLAAKSGNNLKSHSTAGQDSWIRQLAQVVYEYRLSYKCATQLRLNAQMT
jgi:hypothetical protein